MAAQNRRSLHSMAARFSSVAIPITAVIVGWLIADFVSHRWSLFDSSSQSIVGNDQLPIVLIEKTPSNNKAIHRQPNCTYWSCFDPYRCNFYGDSRLTVYIYPWRDYVRNENGSNHQSRRMIPEPSREFVRLLEAVRRSPYYESNPKKACLFLPSIDTLNEDRLDADDVGEVLASLKWWTGGENHLLFNMLPRASSEFERSSSAIKSGRAIVAGGGFSLVRSYRRTFDVSIPVYTPTIRAIADRTSGPRVLLLISTKPFLSPSDHRILQRLQQRHPNEFMFLTACTGATFDPNRRCSHDYRRTEDGDKAFRYSEIMQKSKFCLVLEGSRLGQPELSDALRFGCIPVVIIDEYVLPFSEVLDWKRTAISIYRHQLPDIVEILRRDISPDRLDTMRRQGAWFWMAYFSSLDKIAMTTLRIIQDRVFPHRARMYSEWNDNKKALFPYRPFSPNRIAPNDGFTAVILTYDRLPSLFEQLRKLSRVQSLVKIIVVWNNQRKAPPPADEWPKLNKPLKVIRTSENRLTNRFIPYNEIETEAVLSLDDDILMLNPDELEFGYQAWREFPSYLVGYPSRVHIFDPETRSWTYESEWTNNASLILTGAAFYHNYYNLLFTETVPARVKNWIDRMMNCEDIAMNFLIANNTGQPALKVTPRKKFKPGDTVGQDLSADSAHLKQRSECLNRLSRYFGGMVLKTAEFRLDPLLYKVDAVPDHVKLYPNVGPL